MKLAAVIALLLTCCLLVADARPYRQFKHRDALKWLQKAGYYNQDKDIESMTDDEAAQEIEEPLSKMRKFYRLGSGADLDAETEEVMNKPRCSQPDLPEEEEQADIELTGRRHGRSRGRAPHGRYRRYARLGDSKWDKLPVTVGFKNYWSGDMDQSTQEKVALSCARKWAEKSGLSFRLVRNEIANVYINFGPIEGDAGAYGTIGFAWSPTPWKNPASSEVTMDSREPWKPFATSGGRGISLEEGLCHEMGHALGMGHTNVPKSIMLPSIPGLSTDVILSSDDIAGIQHIYGGPNGQTIVGEAAPSTTTTTTVKTTMTTTTAPTTTTEAPTTVTDYPISTTEEPEPTSTQAPEPAETEAPEPETTKEPEKTTTQEPETTYAIDLETTTTEKPEPTETEEPEKTTTQEPETTYAIDPETTTTEAPEPTATEKREETTTPEVLDTTTQATEKTTEAEPTTTTTKNYDLCRGKRKWYSFLCQRRPRRQNYWH